MSSSDDFIADSDSDYGDSSGSDFQPSPVKKTKTTKAVAVQKTARAPAAGRSRGGGAATTSRGTGRGRGRGRGASSSVAASSVASSSSSSSKKSKASDPSDDDLLSSGDEQDNDDSDEQARRKKARSGPSGPVDVGSKYKKVSQLEHVLLRPDTYVGSIEKTTSSMWVWEDGHMVRKEIEWVPGLYKIFDEILVNAADCAVNHADCDTVKVVIDAEQNTISVWNNGPGIPVEIHPQEKIYVPEMIFGHLLTSSNYDDNEQKITGGRNGFGAKLANIFSTEFTVETVDVNTKKQYVQRFSGNMGQAHPAQITAARGSTGFTKITFKPDLARFGLAKLTADMVALMQKRTYDLAGTGDGLKVYLNGERLPIKNFKQYVDLYMNSPSHVHEHGAPVVYEKVNERWEIAVTRTDGSQFEQVSFVNSISTPRGGTHVEHVIAPILKHLAEAAKKKTKNPIRPQLIKCHLFVFVKSLIVNPAFDSQCKETLMTKPASFGSKCAVSEALLKRLAKIGILDAILAAVMSKADQKLAKLGGAKKSRITGYAKLDDANDAGTRKSDMCTLILTEGDSAKTLAVAGLSVIGRDHYGVFPLRGKLLNARDATATAVAENKELQALTKILGLHYSKKYTTPDELKTLRYGHIMIMTDQDVDGSHIKGLVINWIHAYWPHLVRTPGFLREFITPIVKVKKGGVSLPFYSLPEYLTWKEQHAGGKGWTIRYYKGLGSSSAEEAREYFSDLRRHLIQFRYGDSTDDDRIDMAFSKKRANDRKTWLTNREEHVFLDQNVDYVSYADFVDKELIQFSLADCIRSIPHLNDGFKPGQRKVLFGCLKKKLTGEVKVAQLSGYIGEQTAYHHGEMSLQETIVKMAQCFVGSNNVALLFPAGMFGSRLQGGKDRASARYINTRLSKITRTIFQEADDHVLTYLDDDGSLIEPEFYVPIIPMLLVNGAEGIGTGWSTSIPPYSPYDLIDRLRLLLRGDEQLPELHPFYRGFYGIVEQQPHEPGSYVVRGRWEYCDDDANTVRIWELPVGVWTGKYKKMLEDMLAKNQIANYREYHTETKVHFVVQLTDEQMKKVELAGVDNFFKLFTRVSTTNMHLIDRKGRVTKYASPVDILREFYEIRLDFYGRRKDYLVAQLTEDLQRLENKCRFIRMVVAGELEIRNKPKREIVLALQRHKFKTFMFALSKKKTVREGGGAMTLDTFDDDAPEGSDDDNDEADSSSSSSSSSSADIAALIVGYDYLLSMKLWSLSKESAQKLENQVAEKQRELRTLMAKSPQDLWIADLDNLEQLLDTIEREEYERATATSSKVAKRGAATGKGRGRQASVLPPHPADSMEEQKRAVVVMGRIGDAGVKTETRKRVVRPKKESAADSSSFVDDGTPVKPEPVARGRKPPPGQQTIDKFFTDTAVKTEAVVKKEEPVKQPAAKKAPAKKAPSKIIDDDDSPVKKEPASKKPSDDVKQPKKAAPAKKSTKVIDDDDEEEEEDVVVAPRNVPRRAAAAKPVSYVDKKDSDDDDIDSLSSFDDSFDEDD